MQVLVDLLKSFAAYIVDVGKRHWKKGLLTIGCAILFLILIFPYSDLTSLVSRTIQEQTGISTHSKSLGLSFFPSPGARIESMTVDVSSPPLKIETARIYPSIISSLFGSDFFFSASLSGIFGGDFDFSRSKGDTVPEKEHHKEDIEIEAENINVEELIKFMSSNTMAPNHVPFDLKGKISLESEMQIDKEFGVQPEVEFLLTGEKVEFPAQAVPTQMGPLNVPKLTFSTINVKGRLVGGEIIIEEAQLGKKGDPLSAKIKGKITLKMRKARGKVSSQPGNYQLDIDTSMSQSVEGVVGLLLTPLAGKFKSTTSTGTRYTFRISAPSFGPFPKAQGIRPF